MSPEGLPAAFAKILLGAENRSGILPPSRADRPGGGDGVLSWGHIDTWTSRGLRGTAGVCGAQEGKPLHDGRGQLTNKIVLQLPLGARRGLSGAAGGYWDQKG